LASAGDLCELLTVLQEQRSKAACNGEAVISTESRFGGSLTVHSHALAVSVFCAPLRCHPTLAPVSFSSRFTSIALASVSVDRNP
jgi:hypothetical protein